MDFKTVFLAVGLEPAPKALATATRICGALGAHLSLLAVDAAPPPPASPYGVVANDLWAGEIREGQAAAEARAESLRAELAASAVPVSVEAQFVDRGTVATLAARFARYADLTLIPPPCGQGLQDWVLNGALFESGRPVLLLPDAEVSFPEVRRVMIAWDASVEASKAVRDAIGLMKRAGQVDAVLVDPVPSFDGHGPEPGADLSTYLGRHGITTTVHRLPKEGHDVAEMLRRAATDLGADLAVMGGFGHSRLRQRIFGGTTTDVIKSFPIPVLMAH